MPHKGVIFVACGITLLDECKHKISVLNMDILCF